MNAKSIVMVLSLMFIVGGYALAADGSAADDPADATVSSNLWIYGNVNGDDYIDSADVTLLEAIIAGEAAQVYVSIYDGYNADDSLSGIVSFADVNQDGVIDGSDVEYLEAIIAYQAAYSAAVSAGTLSDFDDELTLFYLNCDLKAASVDLPVRTLGVVYYTNSEVVRLLGATDRVVASDNTTINNHKTLLPEYQREDIFNLGNTRFNLDSETLLNICYDKGMDVMFTGSSSTYSDGLEAKVDGFIDVVRLPAWEDNNFMAGTLTLGYILGATETAYEYNAWAQGYIDAIADALSGLTDEQKVTVLCPKGRVANNCLEGNGPGSGQFEITELAGGINLASKLSASSEYPAFSVEWILSENPDYVIVSGYCGFEKAGEDNVRTLVSDVLDNAYSVYAGTKAADNGHIYFVTSEIFTGPAAIIGMVYIANMLYPELTSGIDGTTAFKEFFEKFCPGMADYDVDAHLAQYVSPVPEPQPEPQPEPGFDGDILSAFIEMIVNFFLSIFRMLAGIFGF